MEVRLDSCVWGPAAAELRAQGHDVVWAGDWEKDPGDREVLARAHRAGRVLLTLDKDFGELAVVRNEPHSGIVRLVGFAARDQASACHVVLVRYSDELRRGALITVDPVKVRVRPGTTRGLERWPRDTAVCPHTGHCDQLTLAGTVLHEAIARGFST